jgi:hypothetical protein
MISQLAVKSANLGIQYRGYDLITCCQVSQPWDTVHRLWSHNLLSSQPTMEYSTQAMISQLAVKSAKPGIQYRGYDLTNCCQVSQTWDTVQRLWSHNLLSSQPTLGYSTQAMISQLAVKSANPRIVQHIGLSCAANFHNLLCSGPESLNISHVECHQRAKTITKPGNIHGCHVTAFICIPAVPTAVGNKPVKTGLYTMFQVANDTNFTLHYISCLQLRVFRGPQTLEWRIQSPATNISFLVQTLYI